MTALFPPRRSIPACAGEPAPRAGAPRPTRVYPRVCGGTVDNLVVTFPFKGLSPRVRGNRAQTGTDKDYTNGLSPRVRGNPLPTVFQCRSPLRVYPRVCGGTAPGIFAAAHLPVRKRSIPACAGEPAQRWTDLPCAVRANRVYPRVCGGTLICRRCQGGPAFGSIPACAGEPLSDLYLFPPLLRSYRLIVLHQVDPVSIDYLLRLLSQYLNSLAAYRRRLPPGHHYRSLLHLGIPPSQYFPDPPPYAACHVWRRVYAGRYLQHGRGKKTSITRRDIDRNNDCHLLPPSSRRARRLATLR